MEMSGLLGFGTNLLEKRTMAADLLVSTEWLAEHLNDPDVRIVDMRGSVVTKQVAPGVEQADYRGARDEYLAAHIPGAVYVDWTADIIDPDDPVPVQIAPADRFAEAMAARGVGDDTVVVAVDHGGGQFATRLWWALVLLRPRPDSCARRRMESMGQRGAAGRGGGSRRSPARSSRPEPGQGCA